MPFDVPLAPLTTLRCGGPARTLSTATTALEMVDLVAACDARGEPVLLLGHGSNVVISDDGFPGTAILVASNGIEVEPVNRGGGTHRVRVAAGEAWDGVVAQAADAGLSGIEALSGIPGTAGAAPVQNIGAYGAELSDVLEAVTAYDRRECRTRSLAADECDFAYRTSRFKRERDRWVVLDIALLLRAGEAEVPVRYERVADHMGLTAGDTAPPGEIRRAVLEVRRAKGMVIDVSDRDTWSVGSFFMNPVVPQAEADLLPSGAPRWPCGNAETKLSAAWLIEASGCHRGWALAPGAPAAISTRHTLALTNRGGAKTADVIALARAVVSAVKQKFAITLEPEPTLIGCSL